MRAAIAVLGFLSAIAGAPWFTALCILMLALRYPAWEAVLLGLFVDLLWMPGASGGIALPYFMIGSVIIVWLFEPLRMQFLR